MARKMWAIFGICLGIFIVAADFTMIFTALPEIQSQSGISRLEAGWVMSLYGLVALTLFVTMGRIGAMVGRKKIFILGLGSFIVGALIVALSTSVEWLMLGRALQGFAAAATLPVAQGLLITTRGKKDERKMIGLWSIILGAGLAAGPFLSGIILTFGDWRWIFIFYIPIMAFALIIFAILGFDSKENAKVSIDWPGQILLALSFTALAIFIQQGPFWGWAAPMSWLFLGIFAVGFFALYCYEGRVKNPIINFEHFYNRNFLLASIISGALMFFVWSSLYLIPEYLLNVRGELPIIAGMILLCFTAPFAIFSFLIQKWLSDVGSKTFLVLGGIALLVSLYLQGGFEHGTHVGMVIVALLLGGLGWVLILTPACSKALFSLAKNESGSGAGVWITIQTFLGVIGLSVASAALRTHAGFFNGFDRVLMTNFFFVLIAALVVLFFLHGKGRAKK